ncbi:hypothetical protein HBI18_143460 [Parastagonospora nodorum]|nr:hypothetical protein HBH82_090500 [Parastagonospora nodorum]KAH4710955.1 hypothetical protein HBH67_032780 [Parastagonospora nodorum]KAH4715099.1 hypothetical protein HBH78_035450 [Parastagonospora nodorum]KAH4784363.1 hypothetical protein HBH62_092430 [Parastagonospora nodorum]KAH4838487.1 hypothetical protein HBH63_010540 [Parastagonospora nodorum]
MCCTASSVLSSISAEKWLVDGPACILSTTHQLQTCMAALGGVEWCKILQKFESRNFCSLSVCNQVHVIVVSLKLRVKKSQHSNAVTNSCA